jgi:hypothetical protein
LMISSGVCHFPFMSVGRRSRAANSHDSWLNFRGALQGCLAGRHTRFHHPPKKIIDRYLRICKHGAVIVNGPHFGCLNSGQRNGWCLVQGTRASCPPRPRTFVPPWKCSTEPASRRGSGRQNFRSSKAAKARLHSESDFAECPKARSWHKNCLHSTIVLTTFSDWPRWSVRQAE